MGLRGEEMKKMSEVCRILGVTRRTLQEYDKIGLLHPSARTEGGYWLYDDNALAYLAQIQIFVECGYKRKEIKDKMHSETFDLLSEYDELVKNLKQKRSRIDEMIHFLNLVKGIGASIPSSVLTMAFKNFEIENFCKKQSFLSMIKGIDNQISINNELEERLLIKFSSLLNVLVGIGNCIESKLTKRINKSLAAYCDITYEFFLLCKEKEDISEKISKRDVIDQIVDFTEWVLFEELFEEYLRDLGLRVQKESIIIAVRDYVKKIQRKVE